MSGTLFTLIENQGGMGDVTAAYWDYFTQKKQARSDDHLVIFSQIRKKKDPSSHPNIHVFPVPHLTFNSHLHKSSLHREVQNLVAQKNIKRILCDYLSYQYVRDLNRPIIADVHYLIAKSNKIHLSQSKSELQSVFFKKVHNLNLKQTVDFFLKREALERELFRRCSSLLVNSKTTKTDVENFYPFLKPQQKIQICPVQTCLPPLSHAQFKKMKPAMLFHGRFNPLKGIHFLPQLAQKVDSDLVMIGADQLIRDNLKSRMPDRLKILNWKTTAQLQKNYLSQFRFHLFPSLYEPWGLALTKSLQNGAICIAHKNSGGHREQIRHGQNGFLVDFESPHFHVDIQNILKKSFTELSHISKAASLQANQKLGTPESYVKNVLDLLATGEHP